MGRDTVIAIADSPLDSGRTLLTTSAFRDGDRPVSLDWFYPSPDGQHVAFGISFDGDEQSILHVIDTDTGEVGPARIPFASHATVAWLPDSTGFYFDASIGPDWKCASKRLFSYQVGDPGPPRLELSDVRDAHALTPQVAADGRWVAAVTGELEPRPSYLKEVGGQEWRPFLLDVDGYCLGAFVGDHYVAICTEGAPRGRIVSIPIVSASDRSSWNELVPESDAVLRRLIRVGDRLVLVGLDDAASRVSVLSLDGRERQEVNLPGDGVVHSSGGRMLMPYTTTYLGTATESILFVHETFDRSPALYRHVFGNDQLEELRAPALKHDCLVSQRVTARTFDGAEIVYWLYHRADLDLSQPHATLLYGYGSWNIALGRGYLGVYTPLIDAGGIVVIAHVRGGGEFGRDFWLDGRLARKQNSFDDLYAVAEALLDGHVTTPGRLALVGASAGGLLAAVALVQRPELWCAVVSLVPICDMLEFTRDKYTASAVLEYGNPADPKEAEILRAYSPYHNIPEGGEFPPTLIYCGANDKRCPAWHGRRFAARLSDASTSAAPILFRAHEHGGHLTVQRDPEQIAEWIGFLMCELGLRPEIAERQPLQQDR